MIWPGSLNKGTEQMHIFLKFLCMCGAHVFSWDISRWRAEVLRRSFRHYFTKLLDLCKKLIISYSPAITSELWPAILKELKGYNHYCCMRQSWTHKHAVSRGRSKQETYIRPILLLETDTQIHVKITTKTTTNFRQHKFTAWHINCSCSERLQTAKISQLMW
jgi:hypothetical protein